MPKYEGHLKNDVFIDAFWSLKQFCIHTGEITVVFNITVANTYTQHKPRPLSPFIISEQDGVKRRDGRDRRDADRQNESFTFHSSSSSSSVAFTRHCCQYSALSIPAAVAHFNLYPSVCVLCPAPCFTSGKVCSDLSWRGENVRFLTLV